MMMFIFWNIVFLFFLILSKLTENPIARAAGIVARIVFTIEAFLVFIFGGELFGINRTFIWSVVAVGTVWVIWKGVAAVMEWERRAELEKVRAERERAAARDAAWWAEQAKEPVEPLQGFVDMSR